VRNTEEAKARSRAERVIRAASEQTQKLIGLQWVYVEAMENGLFQDGKTDPFEGVFRADFEQLIYLIGLRAGRIKVQ